ncbi:MAG: hypothetical protein AVDCRST_MAG30-4300, partial [uncultured Solirubrobacteraceae bacterium]
MALRTLLIALLAASTVVLAG